MSDVSGPADGWRSFVAASTVGSRANAAAATVDHTSTVPDAASAVDPASPRPVGAAPTPTAQPAAAPTPLSWSERVRRSAAWAGGGFQGGMMFAWQHASYAVAAFVVALVSQLLLRPTFSYSRRDDGRPPRLSALRSAGIAAAFAGIVSLIVQFFPLLLTGGGAVVAKAVGRML